MSDPAIRFLGFFNQPDSVTDHPFELDESDVIWSPDVSESVTIDTSDAIEFDDSDSPLTSNSSGNNNYSYRSEKFFGLSAALSDHDRSLVQRKKSCMKMIPPVSNPRSVTSSEDFSGSYTGRFHQSAPVNVPIWPKENNSNNGSVRLGFCEEGEEEVEGEEEEMLPPHEIVARSHSTTFSVFEGVGRTLKGRDLRRVRNAVFQKTAEPVVLDRNQVNFKQIQRNWRI